MDSTRERVFVWSSKVRLFHWLNVITILLLVAIGLVILNAKTLGLSSDGKILLKAVHVIVGYVFAVNFLMRVLWGFIGTGHERWRKVLPFTKGFAAEVAQLKKNQARIYKGHNPVGKLMVAALLLLMSVQLISGLVLAGTDIYYPPLGGHFAESVAVDKSQLDLIKPYSKENVDEAAYQAMRDFRKPFITAHLYSFYLLICLIPLHIAGVIVAERREKSGLVSAMISGYKYLPKVRNKQR